MRPSNDDLIAALRDGVSIAVPYFSGQTVKLFFDNEADLARFADTIRAFLALTDRCRLADTRHAFAYFNDITDESGFDRVEPAMERLAPNSDAIWRFVTPNTLTVQEGWDLGNRDRLRHYLVMEGDCGWEQEHGILMSWRDGQQLVKLSGYDGHPTNGHAYDDLSKDAFVYYSACPERCTRQSTAA